MIDKTKDILVKFWKLIACAFATILFTIMSGWMYWITLTVVELSNKQREDKAQWEKMIRIEERINELHASD